jgi:hypothetical protein
MTIRTEQAKRGPEGLERKGWLIINMKSIKSNELNTLRSKCPPSPRVLIKNFVSSTSASLSSAEGSKDRLHPYFVTGFSDGECCFTIKILKSKRSKFG